VAEENDVRVRDHKDEPWRIADDWGDWIQVSSPSPHLVAVDVAREREREPVLNLHRLRALIAELTRRAALLAVEAGEAPARTAEDERADVVAFLAPSWLAEQIEAGSHVGAAQSGDWMGPGYYAGRDSGGRSVTAYGDTPAWLVRIGAAACVARWTGPHASLADAGKALGAEGGQ